MRIVFMGTPEFAVPALSAIHEQGHEIKYVVTQPDKPKGRGNKVLYTPVKEKAVNLGIEVLQPEKMIESSEEVKKIVSCAPDMIVVSAYGQILPAFILGLPKYGCINIHGSLLPRWRGAAPIQRAIIEGDEETGITIMFMKEGIDTGDIILSKSTKVNKKNASELHDELAVMGAELITRVIEMTEKGTSERIVQDERLVTYAHMISKKDGWLDFTGSPEKLERLIRGVNPWPGAYTLYNGETIKIWEAFPLNTTNLHKEGTITEVSDAGIEISAGGKTLLVTGIQATGKKKVKIKEYLRGNKIEKYTVLG